MRDNVNEIIETVDQILPIMKTSSYKDQDGGMTFYEYPIKRKPLGTVR